MSIISEFKEFAVRGNVMDLAVGVIIGGAFGKIVDSMVGDIIMPVIAFITGGGIDFSNLFIVLGHVPEGVNRTYDALKKAGVPLFAYGNFFTILLNFVILAFVIFQLVKLMNKIRISADNEAAAPEPAPASAPVSEEVMLLREIRDNLAK
jgi:large conductance mechanosensitive channel